MISLKRTVRISYAQFYCQTSRDPKKCRISLTCVSWLVYLSLAIGKLHNETSISDRRDVAYLSCVFCPDGHEAGPAAQQQGQVTQAVFVFTNMLRKLLKDEKPDYIAAVFDTIGTDISARFVCRLQGQSRRDAGRSCRRRCHTSSASARHFAFRS